MQLNAHKACLAKLARSHKAYSCMRACKIIIVSYIYSYTYINSWTFVQHTSLDIFTLVSSDSTLHGGIICTSQGYSNYIITAFNKINPSGLFPSVPTG